MSPCVRWKEEERSRDRTENKRPLLVVWAEGPLGAVGDGAKENYVLATLRGGGGGPIPMLTTAKENGRRREDRRKLKERAPVLIWRRKGFSSGKGKIGPARGLERTV